MSGAKLFKQIRSLRALEAALASGHEVEFTACGDSYDLPPDGESGSEGWVVSSVNDRPQNAAGYFPLGGYERLRARRIAKATK